MSNKNTSPANSAPQKGSRQDYGYFVDISTRWSDNDIYGHVNNVTYYSYFDTVANHYLIHQAGLDIHQGNIIGLVVNSSCDYYAPIAYPDALEGALRINRLGNSSVQYGVAVFKKGEQTPVAEGTFTHVFVERDNRKATPIPDTMRAALQVLVK